MQITGSFRQGFGAGVSALMMMVPLTSIGAGELSYLTREEVLWIAFVITAIPLWAFWAFKLWSKRQRTRGERKQWLMGCAGGILALLALSPLLYQIDKFREKEIGRYTNNAKVVDAVVTERMRDAEMGVVSYLYLVERGRKPSGEPIFVADHVQGQIIVAWKDNETLLVQAEQAHAYKHNMIKNTQVTVDGEARAVRVMFDVPGVD